MIHANNITKKFGTLKAVDNVSLNVDKGQIFGLLGPNAAGKTTIIRILCDILDSDSGDITIDGRSISQSKSQFGYVAQSFGQYEELTVWENLKFYARMYGVTDEQWLLSLLKRYQLEPYKDKFAGSLSGGYQRRLALTCALAHDPKVLFMDEPTAGIDPVTRKLLWDDFYKLSAEGKTLFVTTHYMEEAQRCHQLAFLSSGKIVAEGSPTSIKQALGKAKVYSTKMAYLPKLRDKLLAMDGMILVNQFGNELRVVVEPEVTHVDLENIINSFSSNACKVEISEPNLEDIFIALTQSNK